MLTMSDKGCKNRQITLAIELFSGGQMMAVEKYLLMHYILNCLIVTARHTNYNRKILNITVFWDVMSHDLVEILMFQKNVLPTSKLKPSTLKKERMFLQISANIYQPIRSHIPEDTNIITIAIRI